MITDKIGPLISLAVFPPTKANMDIDEIAPTLKEQFGEVIEMLPVVRDGRFDDYDPYAKRMDNGRWLCVVFHRAETGIRYESAWGDSLNESIDAAMEAILS